MRAKPVMDWCFRTCDHTRRKFPKRLCGDLLSLIMNVTTSELTPKSLVWFKNTR